MCRENSLPVLTLAARSIVRVLLPVPASVLDYRQLSVLLLGPRATASASALHSSLAYFPCEGFVASSFIDRALNFLLTVMPFGGRTRTASRKGGLTVQNRIARELLFTPLFRIVLPTRAAQDTRSRRHLFMSECRANLDPAVAFMGGLLGQRLEGASGMRINLLLSNLTDGSFLWRPVRRVWSA